MLASNCKQVLQLGEKNLKKIARTIKPRGPDAFTIYSQNNLLAAHAHLRITGFKSQPILCSQGVVVYNGEFYNDYKKIACDPKFSDAETLVNILESENEDGLLKLDGEFALSLYSPKRQSIFMLTDTFGTKPLYYVHTTGFVAVGSYNDTIDAFKAGLKPIRMPANKLMQIDINTGKILRSQTVKRFDFTRQKNKSYDQWIYCFNESIKKRTSGSANKYFVPLSAGLDSGLIASACVKRKVKIKCYTVPFMENIATLEKRIKILNNNQISTTKILISQNQFTEMKKYLHKKLQYYKLKPTNFKNNNFPDPDFRNVPGFIASALICEMARKNGYLIQLSGQGGDEVLSDYSTGSMRMSELKNNWSRLTKPWKNLNGGWNAVFLGATERIAGLFGIETRYPFLDFNCVQAFINIHPKIKETRYKGPITEFLNREKFPYSEEKQGFAGFDTKNLSV